LEIASDKLKIKPENYVSSLESPIGVYLRREIFKMGKKNDSLLRKKLYDQIVADQSADGSWDQLLVQTANNLWNLALLGCEADDKNARKALEWLLSLQKYDYRGYPGFFNSPNRKDPSLMRSTFYGEFGPGCSIFYDTAYAVHLFHIYGLDNNKQVQTAVRSYLSFWNPEWCGVWCTLNVLRMLIEHPLSAESDKVNSGLKYFAKRQTKTGAWRGFPFYHTFHALSRAKQIAAKKQLRKAFQSVIRKQNSDGSWGKKEQETETFLVLDAMKNADMI
jgi:hypothetical protein